MAHDDKRHGTTTLFAALNVLNRSSVNASSARRKHPKVQEWLDKRPRAHMHFTLTSDSWMNMVERFFCDITTDSK